MSKQYSYSTTNLYESAYLIAKGFKISGRDTDGRKAVIRFEGNGIGDAALEYYNGALVNAKAFTDAYRTLKDWVCN